MQLNQVLSHINQVEKSKFISCLDKLCSNAANSDQHLAKSVNKIDGQIKHASGSEITTLFSLVSSDFKKNIQEQIALSDTNINLLINILIRDGNCIARTSWIENLYNKELHQLTKLSKELKQTIESKQNTGEFCHSTALSIYYDCVNTAFSNDEKVNREAKISDDERSILNILADRLNISLDEAAALEHLINPIPQNNVLDGLNKLKEMGILFISKKRSEVLIPDEIVEILSELQGKELADKYTVRILRSLSDPELANILKRYNKKTRGIDRPGKINEIIHSRISIRNILKRDIFANDETQNQKKERLKTLITDLDLNINRIGTTIEDRIDVILNTLKHSTQKEFGTLSAAGFKEMYSTIKIHFPLLEKTLKTEFELEETEEIDTEKLRSLSITPIDILYLLNNEQIKTVRDKMSLSKRGKPRQIILNAFANANDKLIENYPALANRDLATLKEAGIEISEPELGIKFEEITKEIFEGLNLNVDEDTRKAINTAKDKTDIIISLSDDDIIIGEAKTCKNGDFAKYSTTSRQVKSYANRCENQGKRVAQVLIIAPSFSTDFVESAEMDTEINISLLEAAGLKKIYDSFKSRRNPKFSSTLLTKGGLLKADLISKNI